MLHLNSRGVAMGERAGDKGERGDRGEVGVEESRVPARWRGRGDLSGSGNSLVLKQDYKLYVATSTRGSLSHSRLSSLSHCGLILP